MGIVRMENVGGAVVKRPFKLGEDYVKAGANLDAAAINAIPKVNRNALVDRGYIDLYPQPPGTQRHVVSAGFGRFNVIEGRKLNADALTRDEAIALAGSDLAVATETPPEPPAAQPAAPTPKSTRAKAKAGRGSTKKAAAQPQG